MKTYGLIGFPIGHSFSKAYFTTKFERESIPNSIFELFPLDKIESFPYFIQSVNGLEGLSVTIPHKESILPFIDALDNVSAVIGAVNCVRVVDGKCYGYNTDVIGFENSFMPLRESHHQQALVLGNGGAAKAVKYVLQKHRIPFLQVSRNQTHNDDCIAYDAIDKVMMDDYQIIINCTPVGMSPEVDKKPDIPSQFLTSRHFVFDLIYNPSSTLLLQEAEKAGAVIKNGYEMLVIQAEESWKIWNDSSINAQSFL